MTVTALTAVSATAAAQGLEEGSVVLPEINVEGGYPGVAPGYIAPRVNIGTKSEALLTEIPRSVSTVTADEISDRDARSIPEALRYTPGVNTSYLPGNMGREYISIRGFNPATQYLDGLKLFEFNWAFEPYGVERVDVLRGPASSLYGQGNSQSGVMGSGGGIVAMTSKRPTEQPFMETILKIGNDERFEAGFDMGGPLNDDKTLLYRFTAFGRLAQGEIDKTRQDRLYIAPAVTWKPHGETSLTVMFNYQYDPNLSVQRPLPRVGTLLPGPNGHFIPRDVFMGDTNYQDANKQFYRIGYDFKHTFDDVFSFEQNLSYQKILLKLKDIQSLGSWSGNLINRAALIADYDVNVFQVDNRVKASFHTGMIRHRASVGADYSWVYYYLGQNSVAIGGLDPYNPNYHQPFQHPTITRKDFYDLQQFGLYVQDEMKIERLSILLGGRYDWASTGSKRKTLTAGVLNNPAWTEREDRHFTWQGGLSYAFDNGIAPYASYSNFFTPLTGTTFGGDTMKPLKGHQYEAGVKYLPPGQNILLTGAVFEINEENRRTLDPAHTGYYIQTAEVKSNGWELEAKTTNVYGFNVAAAYTHIHAKVTKSNTVAEKGHRIIANPDNQASLWTTYTFPKDTVVKGLTLGGGVRYVGHSYGDTANTFKVPDFTLYDAMVRYELGGLSPKLQSWDVAFNATNLTDRRYVASCSSANSCWYGEGRMVTFTLRGRF